MRRQILELLDETVALGARLEPASQLLGACCPYSPALATAGRGSFLQSPRSQ